MVFSALTGLGDEPIFEPETDEEPIETTNLTLSAQRYSGIPLSRIVEQALFGPHSSLFREWLGGNSVRLQGIRHVVQNALDVATGGQAYSSIYDVRSIADDTHIRYVDYQTALNEVTVDEVAVEVPVVYHDTGLVPLVRIEGMGEILKLLAALAGVQSEDGFDWLGTIADIASILDALEDLHDMYKKIKAFLDPLGTAADAATIASGVSDVIDDLFGDGDGGDDAETPAEHTIAWRHIRDAMISQRRNGEDRYVGFNAQSLSITPDTVIRVSDLHTFTDRKAGLQAALTEANQGGAAVMSVDTVPGPTPVSDVSCSRIKLHSDVSVLGAQLDVGDASFVSEALSNLPQTGPLSTLTTRLADTNVMTIDADSKLSVASVSATTYLGLPRHVSTFFKDIDVWRFQHTDDVEPVELDFTWEQVKNKPVEFQPLPHHHSELFEVSMLPTGNLTFKKRTDTGHDNYIIQLTESFALKSHKHAYINNASIYGIGDLRLTVDNPDGLPTEINLPLTQHFAQKTHTHAEYVTSIGYSPLNQTLNWERGGQVYLHDLSHTHQYVRSVTETGGVIYVITEPTVISEIDLNPKFVSEVGFDNRYLSVTKNGVTQTYDLHVIKPTVSFVGDSLIIDNATIVSGVVLQPQVDALQSQLNALNNAFTNDQVAEGVSINTGTLTTNEIVWRNATGTQTKTILDSNGELQITEDNIPGYVWSALNTALSVGNALATLNLAQSSGGLPEFGFDDIFGSSNPDEIDGLKDRIGDAEGDINGLKSRAGDIETAAIKDVTLSPAGELTITNLNNLAVGKLIYLAQLSNLNGLLTGLSLGIDGTLTATRYGDPLIYPPVNIILDDRYATVDVTLADVSADATGVLTFIRADGTSVAKSLDLTTNAQLVNHVRDIALDPQGNLVISRHDPFALQETLDLGVHYAAKTVIDALSFVKSVNVAANGRTLVVTNRQNVATDIDLEYVTGASQVQGRLTLFTPTQTNTYSIADKCITNLGLSATGTLNVTLNDDTNRSEITDLATRTWTWTRKYFNGVFLVGSELQFDRDGMENPWVTDLSPLTQGLATTAYVDSQLSSGLSSVLPSLATSGHTHNYYSGVTLDGQELVFSKGDNSAADRVDIGPVAGGCMTNWTFNPTNGNVQLTLADGTTLFPGYGLANRDWVVARRYFQAASYGDGKLYFSRSGFPDWETDITDVISDCFVSLGYNPITGEITISKGDGRVQMVATVPSLFAVQQLEDDVANLQATVSQLSSIVLNYGRTFYLYNADKQRYLCANSAGVFVSTDKRSATALTGTKYPGEDWFRFKVDDQETNSYLYHDNSDVTHNAMTNASWSTSTPVDLVQRLWKIGDTLSSGEVTIETRVDGSGSRYLMYVDQDASFYSLKIMLRPSTLSTGTNYAWSIM